MIIIIIAIFIFWFYFYLQHGRVSTLRVTFRHPEVLLFT